MFVVFHLVQKVFRLAGAVMLVRIEVSTIKFDVVKAHVMSKD